MLKNNILAGNISPDKPKDDSTVSFKDSFTFIDGNLLLILFAIQLRGRNVRNQLIFFKFLENRVEIENGKHSLRQDGRSMHLSNETMTIRIVSKCSYS